MLPSDSGRDASSGGILCLDPVHLSSASCFHHGFLGSAIHPGTDDCSVGRTCQGMKLFCFHTLDVWIAVFECSR